MKRVVVVVGASSGVGRATAHLLAERGARLVLASRSSGPLDEAAAECRLRGAASVETVPVDIRDAGAVRDLLEGAEGRHGRLDAVINCAAVLSYGRFDEVPTDVVDGLLSTNVHGSAHVAQEALRIFRRQSTGTLVLLGSLLGRTTVPGMTPYITSKWAVRGLAHQLRLESRDVPGISVCLVAPGAVDTPIYRLAANFHGRKLKPPGPVVAPERVAREVVALLDRPRPEVSVGVGPFNGVMRFGFSVLQPVYERLVGPMARVLGTSSEPAAPTAGNVLRPTPRLEAVSGGQNGEQR